VQPAIGACGRRARPGWAVVVSLDAALAAARGACRADLDDLLTEVRIPSISTLAERRADCRRNADWLVERLQKLGFDTSLIEVRADGNPVLRADWMGRPGAPVLTIYGHYDVQPTDPIGEWKTDPFDPIVIDGFVHARGVADNKGNHMAALKAVEHWMSVGGPPVNIRFLIEGEEEIGGESLPDYLRASASDLATDLVVLWDGGFTADDRPNLMVGLRGLLYVEVAVSGAAGDLHSGGFGGIAPNACLELARIIASLRDSSTERVTVPGFYDDVIVPSATERASWHQAPDMEARMKTIMGTDSMCGEADHDIFERLWVRPTLEVNGLWGGFSGEGMKTIVPARATAKLSMRLVPDQDASKIVASLTAAVAAAAGPGVSTEVRVLGSSPPIFLGHDHTGARALSRALSESFDTPAVVVRSGGSIPVATVFTETLGAPMVISGIGHVASGAHGPNERLAIGSYTGGIETMVRLMQYVGDGDS